MSNFEQLGADIGRLVQEKQTAYGDSFGKSGQVLRLLYPDGVKADQMDDMLAVARVVDKLFRIATAKDAFGESPWRDVAGYGLLGAARSAPADGDPPIAIGGWKNNEPAVINGSPPVVRIAKAKDDLGVTYQERMRGGDLRAFVRVAANPKPGEYVFDRGVWTFHEDDRGRTVLVSYTFGEAARVTLKGRG